jgi:hypothetical protein
MQIFRKSKIKQNEKDIKSLKSVKNVHEQHTMLDDWTAWHRQVNISETIS